MLHRIVIPHEHSLQPWIVKLNNVVGISNVKFDVSFFISQLHDCDGADQISCIVEDWDYSCESPSGVLTHIPILDYWGNEYRPGLLFDLDEDTGRFIHFYKDELSVVDIVATG